jgi:hypothetical protein
MIMKNTLILLCLSLTVLNNRRAFGQAPALPAQFGPHQWTATVKVIGEDGNPIVGANVAVSYTIPVSLGSDQPTYGEVKGITNTNGMFTASHTDSSWDLGVVVEKTGYYRTQMGHEFYFDEKNRHPSFTLLLKKIGKPIPMYARRIDSEPPVFKKTGRPPIIFTNSMGYDLMAGDWIAPYGKGANTDVIFTEEFNKKSIADFYYKLTVSFPKPGDGVQEFSVLGAEKGSALRSPHEAPLDGYQAQLTRENYHHSGQAGKADYDPNRNYFFRIRTVLDSNGNVKSALYGKIYGDPEQMNFSYYLNPTPNDRNIEFDPKQDLLGGLQPVEQVSQP